MLFDCPGYLYQGLVTNLPRTQKPVAVWREYNGRAACENIIKELDAGYGLPQLACRDFWGTEAALSLGVLAHNLIGAASVALSGWALMRVRKFGTIVFPIATLAGLWVLGAAFYFYMPLASMTNPPLNWGYPRTWDGFLHALTRGQYEKTNPTANFGRFMDQMGMLLHGAVDEFNLVYLLIGLIPFFFFRRMQKREQGWFAVPYPGVEALAFNASRPLFSDPTVRRAAAFALNRVALVGATTAPELG